MASLDDILTVQKNAVVALNNISQQLSVSGTGTVNSGISGQLAYYSATGSAVSGNSNVTISSAALTLGVTGTATGSLIFSGATSGKVTIKSADTAGSWSLTLPTDSGTNGYVLQTDGSGVTSWTPNTTGGGTVSTGTAGQLAYYSATGSTVSGNSNVTISSAALTLGVAGTATGSLLLSGASSGVVTVKPSSAAGTWSLTLPTTAGSNGYVLATDGTGITSWVSGGTVSTGTAGQLAYYSATGSTVSGNSNVTISSAALTLGVAGTATGSLIFSGATSGKITLKSADTAGTWSLTLPTSAGTNGYVLQTDGSGVTSWVSGGSGTVSSSTAGQLAYYSATGSTVSGTTTGTGVLTAIASSLNGSGSLVGSTSATLTTPAISGGTIDNATIGATTASTGKFTSLNLNGTSGPSISTSPTANPTGGTLLATYGNLVVQATTSNASNREFMGIFGLTSNNGSGVTNNNGDKVALYAAIDAISNSGDAWAFNTVTTLESTAPSTIRSYGYECDLNNYSADKTLSNLGTTTNFGIAITGLGYLGTSALFIDGANSVAAPAAPYYNLPKWDAGILFTSLSAKSYTILDQTNTTVGFYQSGSHTTGISLSGGTYSFAAIDVGSNYIKGAAGAIIGTSDARTKTDIQNTDLGLDFVNKLRPVSYIYNKDEYRVSGDKKIGETKTKVQFVRRHHGLIAQEVRELIDPDKFAGWVIMDKNDPDSEQGLRYDEFIAPLIKAVQELTVRLEAAENKLKGL